MISDLQEKLKLREEANAEIKREYQERLNEAETKQLSLQRKIQAMQRIENRLNTLSSERGGLEKSLAKSRQSLIQKLREKEIIEKDLTYHRTELERRLLEKQRVEELLYEKNKYEKELLEQKEQLSCDLDKIEKKLKRREGAMCSFNSEEQNTSTGTYNSEN